MDEARLSGVERHMIKMMYGVRLVDSVSIVVLCDRVGVVVKIGDMIIQSRLRWLWSCHAWRHQLLNT